MAFSQDAIQYVETVYGVDVTRANEVLQKAHDAAGDSQMLQDDLNVPGAPTFRYQIGSVADGLGLKKVGDADAVIKQQQTAAGAAQQTQSAADDQAAQKTQTASQVAAAVAQGVQDGTISPDEASTSLQQALEAQGISGTSLQNTPQSVLDMTGGTAPSADQLNAAKDAYNRMNPTRPVTNGADLYYRINSGDPSAMYALGSSMEGHVSSYSTFNVFDPATNKFRKETVRNDQLEATLAVAPSNVVSSMDQLITASKRQTDVPFQLLAAASKMMRLQPEEFQNGRGGLISGGGMDFDFWAQTLQGWMHEFGDYGLALVALKNPDLAKSIYAQGFANPDQAQEVSQYLLDAGFTPEQMAKQGLAINTAKYGAMTGASGAAGGGATIVPVEDPKKLQEGVQQLFRAWFNRDASDSEVQQYGGMLHALLVGAAQAKAGGASGNIFRGIAPAQGVSTVDDVDWQTRLMDSLRQSPEYQSLFGKKPSGMSEEDYSNQFKQAQQSMMGPQAGPAAVRAGMQTGNTQTTIGYASGEASAKDNSSFQQRLAVAAQTVARMT